MGRPLPLGVEETSPPSLLIRRHARVINTHTLPFGEGWVDPT